MIRPAKSAAPYQQKSDDVSPSPGREGRDAGEQPLPPPVLRSLGEGGSSANFQRRRRDLVRSSDQPTESILVSPKNRRIRDLVSSIPKGLRPKARGCRVSEATLGILAHKPVNPDGVVPFPFLITALGKLRVHEGPRVPFGPTHPQRIFLRIPFILFLLSKNSDPVSAVPCKMIRHFREILHFPFLSPRLRVSFFPKIKFLELASSGWFNRR